MRVVRHALNTTGRDLVIGDVHATFSVVAAALQGARFNWGADRLFSVGDLVDRGPEPKRALAFLRNPRIHAIRGNHEDMFLECYQDGIPDEEVLRYWTRHNGMSWWMDLSHDERMAFIEAFRQLPIVMEIETERGIVGLVHGEVPHGMDWATFVQRIEDGDRHTTKSALWGRNRIQHGDDSGVIGIDRLFCGHTVVNAPTRLGNVYYIDSGSFVGVRENDAEQGRLTIADLCGRTGVFHNPPSGEFFDIRDERAEPGQRFGAYARHN